MVPSTGPEQGATGQRHHRARWKQGGTERRQGHAQLGPQGLVERLPRRIQVHLAVCDYWRNIADVVESTFVPSGQRHFELPRGRSG